MQKENRSCDNFSSIKSNQYDYIYICIVIYSYWHKYTLLVHCINILYRVPMGNNYQTGAISYYRPNQRYTLSTLSGNISMALPLFTATLIFYHLKSNKQTSEWVSEWTGFIVALTIFQSNKLSNISHTYLISPFCFCELRISSNSLFLVLFDRTNL